MQTCPSCNAAIAPGSRWCPICHANIVSPRSGRLSSPGKRLGAYVLDLMAPILAFLLIVVIAGMGLATGSDAGLGASGLLGFGLGIGYVVWAFVLFARGTTPGKKLLGMYVMKEDGQPAGFLTMFLREWIGKPLSGMILGLGFLWILFDRENQGWHDKLTSTFVVSAAGPAVSTQSVVP